MTNQTKIAFKLAVIGEVMAEISGTPFSLMQQNMGGDTLNTAVYLKQMLPDESTISFVTVMGEDVLTKAIVARIQDYGLDTSKVLYRNDKQIGLYYVHNDTSGERYFQYWRNDSAARYLMQDTKIDAVFNTLLEFDAVFLSGISLAILPASDATVLLSKLSQLKCSGVKVVFDGNYREALWSSKEQARELYKKMYQLADLALVTFDDEQQLWQDDNIAACQDRLSQFDIGELVVKDGGNGCIYVSPQQTLPVATKLVTKVVDTTAAGDSFNAGFLAGWFSGLPAQSSCLLGNKLAGQVIQAYGAIVDVDFSFFNSDETLSI